METVGIKVASIPVVSAQLQKKAQDSGSSGMTKVVYTTTGMNDNIIRISPNNAPGTHEHLVSLSGVTSMNRMFTACTALTSLDLSSFDTSNVTDMSYMFLNCGPLKSLNLSSFDTSNVVYMNEMFKSCQSLKTLDLSSFNTSNVTIMRSMFENCYELTSLDLSSFDTSKVTDMLLMFYDCIQLTSLDLGLFDMSKVRITESMFYDCTALTTVRGNIIGISVSLDLKSCPLTNESAMVFINGLAKVTTARTISFNSSTYNTLTEEQIAVATSKGWNVVNE